jgi:iron complex outermembrane recepter protein
VTELYQNITVNGVLTFANPNLLPEEDFSGEVNLERKWIDGRVGLTMFGERANNAIISQTNLATNPNTGAQVPTTTIGNVAAIRMLGVEASAEKNNVLFNRLQLFGSVTYVASLIVSDPTWAESNQSAYRKAGRRRGQPRAPCARLARQVRLDLPADRRMGLDDGGAL